MSSLPSPESCQHRRLWLITEQKRSPGPAMVVNQAERTIQMEEKGEKMASAGPNC